jgi:ABC-type multidrug transport system fused ATPase/permease subunit
MCGLLVALALVGLAAAVVAQYFAAKAATGFAADVRHALFQRLAALSFPDVDRIGVPAMITRMTSDVNQAQTGVNMALRLLLRSPFVVLGAMAMAFTIDARCALIFLAVIAALGAVVSFFLSGGTSDDTVYAIYALLLALLVPKFIEQGCGRRVDFGRTVMLIAISLFIVSALIMHYA